MKNGGGLLLLAGVGAAAWYYLSNYSTAVTQGGSTGIPVTVAGVGPVTLNPITTAPSMNCPGDPGCPGGSAALAQVTTGGSADSVS
jgi:hypothetical protein